MRERKIKLIELFGFNFIFFVRWGNFMFINVVWISIVGENLGYWSIEFRMLRFSVNIYRSRFIKGFIGWGVNWICYIIFSIYGSRWISILDSGNSRSVGNNCVGSVVFNVNRSIRVIIFISSIFVCIYMNGISNSFFCVICCNVIGCCSSKGVVFNSGISYSFCSNINNIINRNINSIINSNINSNINSSINNSFF